MIEIFRTNQIFATLLLIPYTFLIRIYSLIHPIAYEVQPWDTPFSKYLFTSLIPSPIMQSIVACIVVFLIANFINRHIIQNRLSKHLTLLPGLFFILITASMPGGIICSPALLSGFFLMLAMMSINRIYKTNDAAIRIFNAGLYVALALILYPANLFFWVFCIISLMILRSLKLSELLMLTSGIFIPVFLLGTYYYWNGELHLIWDYFQFDKGILALFLNLNLNAILYLVAIGVIVIYCIVRYNTFTMKSAIQVQKKVDIVYWFMLFSLLIMFFVNGITFTHLVILAIPFSMFIGLSFEKMKNSMIAEMIHVIILIAILFTQFQGLLL